MAKPVPKGSGGARLNGVRYTSQKDVVSPVWRLPKEEIMILVVDCSGKAGGKAVQSKCHLLLVKLSYLRKREAPALNKLLRRPASFHNPVEKLINCPEDLVKLLPHRSRLCL